jgi:hypothetical protein
VRKYGYGQLMFAHFGASFNIPAMTNFCLHKHLRINRD